MAKFLKNSSGSIAEEAAVSTSAGAGDSGKVPELNGSGVLDDSILNASVTSAANKIAKLDGTGRLDSGVMPVGIGADTDSVVSSENLAAGDMVNIWDNGGTPNVRKADASNGRRAHGFVLAGVTSPAAATVYKEGMVTGLTSKTPGATQYLSGGTAGALTETAPSTSGYIVQEVGVAFSATEVDFEPQRPITLA